MENIPWFHHIELVGIFLIIVYLTGTVGKVLIERWLSKKECVDCPVIKERQRELREETLPMIKESIIKIDGRLESLDDKLKILTPLLTALTIYLEKQGIKIKEDDS